MNLVRTLIHKKTLIAGLVLVAGLGAVRYTLTPEHIEVFTDQRFAPEVRSALKKSVAECAVRSLGAQGIFDLLTREYPFIQDISIEYRSPLRAWITVTSLIPQVCIVSSIPANKEYVLCVSKKHTPRVIQQVEKRLLSPEATSLLPTVIIESPLFEQTRALAEFIDCVCAMKSSLFDVYTVTWRSKSDIILQSKTQPILIMADVNTVHDDERLAYVQSIFNVDNESYKDGMRADIRLRDSVVCAPLARK